MTSYPYRNSQKISEFTTENILTDADLFTFVRNATNLNVPFSQFKLALGVTGSLESVGNAFATPVLTGSGTDYQIRAIESNKGIVSTISAENGINLACNFVNGTGGNAIITDLNASQYKFKSIKAGTDISIVDDGESLELSVSNTDILNNRVVVRQASDLTGVLSSTKEYFIDGVIDMGSQTISVPAGGLNLSGYNFDVSKLISSENNYTMFISPGGGSGNLLGKDYAIEVTGASSKVYNLISATGFDAFEFARINYNNCTSLGEINGYRQGLESGTGRFGGQPELTLSGTWLGGYFIDTSIVRGLTDGAYSLFKAGAGFSMNSRFRSNQNIDLPASVSFFDFSPSQFVNPSTVQIEGAIITRNGVFDATDPNITPNMSKGDLASRWRDNNGMQNTFEGGSIGVTTEAVTTINTIGVFETLNASVWTAQDLQHFDNPSAGQLRHLGNTPREYKVIANFSLDSTSGDDLTLRIKKWDDSASSFVTVLDQTREVNNLVGGRDVAFFNVNINTELDQNDYIVLDVANTSSTSNVTAEVDSYFIVEQR